MSKLCLMIQFCFGKSYNGDGPLDFNVSGSQMKNCTIIKNFGTIIGWSKLCWVYTTWLALD